MFTGLAIRARYVYTLLCISLLRHHHVPAGLRDDDEAKIYKAVRNRTSL